MAFLREYVLNEDSLTVVKYFYHDHSSAVPSMVIRLNYATKSLSVNVRSYYVASQPFLVVQEIQKLYELIEKPHWKSFCRIVTPDHRIKLQDLFSGR